MTIIEPKFNLIDEPWIQALMLDGAEKKFGIRDVLLHAHEIRSLADETPLQDAAILRTLIALNVTILYRYDGNGEEIKITGMNDALARFRKTWGRGAFSENALCSYLGKWNDRFYLVGGSHPFYQVPPDKMEIKAGKKEDDFEIKIYPYAGKKDKLSRIELPAMSGEILRSGNSPAPFADVQGGASDATITMPLDEAARWLVYYMNFSDRSMKPTPKPCFATSGALVHPVGQNLFETIMLCSVMFGRNNEIYKSVSPSWESDVFTPAGDMPYGEDGFPGNLPELYTQLSRKALLHVNKNGNVDCLYAGAGDFYSPADALIEPMFSFHICESGPNKGRKMPKHISGGNAWKSFKRLFLDDTERPSWWINVLFDEGILPDDANIPFAVTDIRFKSTGSGVVMIYSSGIVANKKFFTDSDEMDQAREEIDCINEITGRLKGLGNGLDAMLGYNGKSGSGHAVLLGEQYENQIGSCFCQYLAGKITESELRKKEFWTAYLIAQDALSAIPMHVLAGHGERAPGSIINNFYIGMGAVKEKYGYPEDINGKDNE